MKNNEKKNLIITCAKKVFYTEGYHNASLEKIAKQCNIQKQLITYYFGSKANLGQQVYEEISNDFLNIFEKKAKEKGIADPVIADAASALWIPRYYTNDEKAHRFFDEFVYGSLSDISNFRYEEERHLSLALISSKDVPREIREADYISARYAAKGILFHFCRKELDISLEHFEKYYYLTCFRPFTRDEILLEEIYTHAKNLLDSITICVKPNFTIE